MNTHCGIEIPYNIKLNHVSADVIARLSKRGYVVVEFDDGPEDQKAVDQVTEVVEAIGGLVSLPVDGGDARHFFVLTLFNDDD